MEQSGGLGGFLFSEGSDGDRGRLPLDDCEGLSLAGKQRGVTNSLSFAKEGPD